MSLARALPPVRPPPSAFGGSDKYPVATTKAQRLEAAKWMATERRNDLAQLRELRKGVMHSHYDLTPPKPKRAPPASRSPRGGLESKAMVRFDGPGGEGEVGGWFDSPMSPPYPEPPGSTERLDAWGWPAREADMVSHQQAEALRRLSELNPGGPEDPLLRDMANPVDMYAHPPPDFPTWAMDGGFPAQQAAHAGASAYSALHGIYLSPVPEGSPRWPMEGCGTLLKLDVPGGEQMRLERAHTEPQAEEGAVPHGAFYATPVEQLSAYAKGAGLPLADEALTAEVDLTEIDEAAVKEAAAPATPPKRRHNRVSRHAPLPEAAKSPKVRKAASGIVAVNRFLKKAERRAELVRPSPV